MAAGSWCLAKRALLRCSYRCRHKRGVHGSDDQTTPPASRQEARGGEGFFLGSAGAHLEEPALFVTGAACAAAATGSPRCPPANALAAACASAAAWAPAALPPPVPPMVPPAVQAALAEVPPVPPTPPAPALLSDTTYHLLQVGFNKPIPRLIARLSIGLATCSQTKMFKKDSHKNMSET